MMNLCVALSYRYKKILISSNIGIQIFQNIVYSYIYIHTDILRFSFFKNILYVNEYKL
jgi:hypothetical protein